MGCNCKSKAQPVKTPSEVKAVQMEEVKQLALKTILEMELALIEYSSNPEQKIKLQKFMMETFGELIPEYCDTICQSGIRKKLENIKKHSI